MKMIDFLVLFMDINWVRSQFPGLGNPTVFLDNAGGSQTLQTVINRIGHYLIHHDVQLGANYAASVQAKAALQKATESLLVWLNAAHLEEVVVGPSTTALLRILSLSFGQTLSKGDEIIITDVDHESNRACWLDLEKQGMVVKTWCINRESQRLESDDLVALIGPRTRLLCFTHVSNVLGAIHPIEEWVGLAHERGVQVCVDGVAFAPHRLLDVQAWDVDYYLFSTYKTFGPHQAVLYGKKSLLEALPGINHGFITTSPYKFQPGNVNYELAYSLQAVVEYVAQLASGPVNRASLASGFKQIAAHERTVMQPLLHFLNNEPKVTLVGPESDAERDRVATVSFIHHEIDSRTIAQAANQAQFGIRFGDFYAVALIDALGLRQRHGVVRVSLAHYNTADEMDRLIRFLSEFFDRY